MKVKEPRSQIVKPRTIISIPPGRGGYKVLSLEVDDKGKFEHSIIFNISVSQPPGRTDLDIRFILMDDKNYHDWLRGAPHEGLTIVPRLIYGSLFFKPPSSGLYHAVLDNQYSSFTGKETTVEVIETWLEEREIEAPVVEKIVERVVEKPVEVKPKEKIGWLRRLFNRLRYSRSLGLIGIFTAVEFICFLVAVAVAVLFQMTLSLDYRDIIPYIATGVGGSAVLLNIAFIYLYTGRTWPPPLTIPPT